MLYQSDNKPNPDKSGNRDSDWLLPVSTFEQDFETPYDDDGDLDLVVSYNVFGDHSIELYSNIGSPSLPSYESWQTITSYMYDMVNDVDLVDIDGDDDLDLFFG